jgi:hypothetical protein
VVKVLLRSSLFKMPFILIIIKLIELMHKRPPPTSTSFLLVKTTKKGQEETKREIPSA